MKKKLIPLFMLAALPVLAVAAGGHDHGAAMQGSGHGQNAAAMHGGMHGNMHGSASRAGQPGKPDQVSRTIEVVMDDNMRFTPDRFQVKAGETVRFFVKNAGKVPHEMVIGSMDELKAHAEMMRKMPGMEHADDNMITLKPGQRGALVWKFDQPGTVDIACLVPGHFEAGMVARVEAE